jgi:putative Mn2+ efflux pump MntP
VTEYFGGYRWLSDDGGDNDETAKARRLINARGLALIGLALSISLDELTIGFSFGLGGILAEPTTIIAVITIQALTVSQLGLSLGARISEGLRERIERSAGPVLIFLGFYPLTEALIRNNNNLIPPRGAAITGVIVIILAIIIAYRRLAAQTYTDPATPLWPAFGTNIGQLNELMLLRPRSWLDGAITTSRPWPGRPRRHPGVSPSGGPTRDYGPRRDVSDEVVRSAYGRGGHIGS